MLSTWAGNSSTDLTYTNVSKRWQLHVNVLTHMCLFNAAFYSLAMRVVCKYIFDYLNDSVALTGLWKLLIRDYISDAHLPM